MAKAKSNDTKSPPSPHPLPPHRPRRRHSRPRIRIDNTTRRRIEDAIERMIEVIDAIDDTELEVADLDFYGEADELDKLEASELDIRGEGDGDCGDNVDDEPSLGSLDGRMSQNKWCQPDYTPKGCSWTFRMSPDVEYDEAEFETEDEREQDPAEAGIGDMDGLIEQVGNYVAGIYAE